MIIHAHMEEGVPFQTRRHLPLVRGPCEAVAMHWSLIVENTEAAGVDTVEGGDQTKLIVTQISVVT